MSILCSVESVCISVLQIVRIFLIDTLCIGENGASGPLKQFYFFHGPMINYRTNINCVGPLN